MFHLGKITFSIWGEIARPLQAIIKARKVFNQKTHRTLYYTFIYLHFNYCLDAWGNAYSYNLDPLIKFQYRALWIITSSPWRTCLAPLYMTLKLIKFPKIYAFNTIVDLSTASKYYTKYISGNFLYKLLHVYVSGRNTRQCDLLRMSEG